MMDVINLTGVNHRQRNDFVYLYVKIVNSKNTNYGN
jgi:hypothetical protein